MKNHFRIEHVIKENLMKIPTYLSFDDRSFEGKKDGEHSKEKVKPPLPKTYVLERERERGGWWCSFYCLI